MPKRARGVYSAPSGREAALLPALPGGRELRSKVARLRLASPVIVREAGRLVCAELSGVDESGSSLTFGEEVGGGEREGALSATHQLLREQNLASFLLEQVPAADEGEGAVNGGRVMGKEEKEASKWLRERAMLLSVGHLCPSNPSPTFTSSPSSTTAAVHYGWESGQKWPLPPERLHELLGRPLLLPPLRQNGELDGASGEEVEFGEVDFEGWLSDEEGSLVELSSPLSLIGRKELWWKGSEKEGKVKWSAVEREGESDGQEGWRVDGALIGEARSVATSDYPPVYTSEAVYAQGEWEYSTSVVRALSAKEQRGVELPETGEDETDHFSVPSYPIPSTAELPWAERIDCVGVVKRYILAQSAPECSGSVVDAAAQLSAEEALRRLDALLIALFEASEAAAQATPYGKRQRGGRPANVFGLARALGLMQPGTITHAEERFQRLRTEAEACSSSRDSEEDVETVPSSC